MDPLEALTQILQQINGLSGSALDMLTQASGGGESAGGGPAPEGEPGAPSA